MTSSKLKLLARIQLKKNFWQPVSVASLLILIYTLFSFYQANVTQTISTWSGIIISLGISFIFSMIFNVFIAGLYKYYLNQAERKESLFSDLLYGLKNSPDRIIAVSFFKVLITRLPLLPGILCTAAYYIDGCKQEVIAAGGILLLIIGAIVCYILSLSFSQILFIAADSTSLNTFEILRRSRHIMNGNKERMFMLQLSFIPLVIVSIFTMYLGFFITIPYYVASTCYFYLDLNRRIEPKMFFREE